MMLYTLFFSWRFLLKRMQNMNPSCGKDPDLKVYSLCLFIAAVHVSLQEYPLLHMNYVNYLNYIPNAHSRKPASCVKFNRGRAETDLEI